MRCFFESGSFISWFLIRFEVSSSGFSSGGSTGGSSCGIGGKGIKQSPCGGGWGPGEKIIGEHQLREVKKIKPKVNMR